MWTILHSRRFIQIMEQLEIAEGPILTYSTNLK
jgi:hypothetical protein